MEWLYGLLAGSVFTALMMGIAHEGHLEKIKRDAEQASKDQVPESTRSNVAAHLERGNAVRSLEDVPTNCSCDWEGDQNFCEAEPHMWYRTWFDEKCEVHSADDAWLRRYMGQYRGV